MVQENTKELIKNILKKLKPPDDIEISQWADTYRMLPAESSAEPGRWRTKKTPYLKKIMDSISDEKVKKVVVMSSAQVGKSEVLLNTIGYYSHIDPSPMLLIQPTVDIGKNFSKERIAPTFRDTPVLANIIADDKSTILKKEFAGGYIAIVGANAPSGLASRPIRILLADEIDRYPVSAGDEGDPLTLGEKRTSTFPYTYKKIYVSTPTIAGISRIEHEFNLGTMEEWQLQCPGCGEYMTLTFDNLRFSLEEKTRKLIESEEILCFCTHCRERNNEVAWKSGKGRWYSEKNIINNEVKSFHLSSLVSPWKSWKEIVEAFLSARKEKEMLKVWTNTEMGLPFNNYGDNLNEIEIFERREKYGCDLPDGVLLLTAGVDVQDDRFEIEVVGWGRNNESWGIKYHKLFGNLDKKEIWQQLDVFLSQKFKFINGQELSIIRVCIDSGGHYTDQVYKFCRQPHKVEITPIKGMGGNGIKFLHKTYIDKVTKVRLQILGVNNGKETIMSRLRIEEIGENYCHFPKEQDKGYDIAYFQGLTAEHQVTRVKNGMPRTVWELKKSNSRNEPLDIRNYAMAAYELRMPIDFDSLEKQISDGINHSEGKEVKESDRTRKVRRKTSNLL